MPIDFDNKLIKFAVLGGVSVVSLLMVTISGVRASSLSSDLALVESRVIDLENEKKTLEFERTALINKELFEYSGISSTQVSADQSLAQDFFKPAFDWKSGKEYDDNREGFIQKLGAENRFVTTYMVENTKTTDGEFNEIDHNGIRSTLRSIDMYPLRATNTGYDYVGFVTYVIYKDESDLGSINKLEPSHAIIQFSVIGDEDSRAIASVSAWAGSEFSN